MQENTPQNTAGEIILLYNEYGAEDYIGEAVSQVEHSCQAAQLAEAAGCGDEMILAAFLHDIGHFCERHFPAKQMGGFGAAEHETLGADFLRSKGFSEKIVSLVQNHVQAKRYLTYRSPEYYAQLSEASRKTLEYQGGMMTQEEAAQFEADPLFAQHIQLRRWDELAKEENKPLPPLDKYRAMMATHLNKRIMKTRMVVFDMAGTTIDEDNAVYKTLQKAINEAGFSVSLSEVLAQGAGKEKLQAIASILNFYAGIADDVLAQNIYKNFIGQLSQVYAAQNLLSQPHATETFAALKEKGILIVLNTGYDRHTAQQILDKLGWKQSVEYDLLVTATDVDKNRPEPDMIFLAMKHFGINESKEVAKIGDSSIDIMEGKNAGCGLSIGITTGAHTFEQLQAAMPDYIINDLIELVNIIHQ